MIRAYLRKSKLEREFLWLAYRELRQAKRDLRSDAGATLMAARGLQTAAKISADSTLIASSIKAVAKRMRHTRCLPQAIAAQRMLHAAGHDATIHVGAQPEGDFEAHAWVTLHDRVVIGNLPGLENYREFA